jgi:hypothetical protein
VRQAHATLELVADPAAELVALHYSVPRGIEAWVLPEGTVPESFVHDDAASYLKEVLEGWKVRQRRPLRIARNLGIRWLREMPQIGIDPDVCVLDPPPSEPRVGSLCLWKRGHVAPSICFEVVSKNHPHKDYRDLHERYAALGARELAVFDPLLAGPRSLGGPVSIQLWRRQKSGELSRVYAGPGPVYSRILGAWLICGGELLTIADQRDGSERWQTPAERERAAKERERAAKERERAGRKRERGKRAAAERALTALRGRKRRP